MISRFERFDRVLQVFDKLAHDIDCRRFVFDLDGYLAAHKLISQKGVGALRYID
jgi:hypothetical protein